MSIQEIFTLGFRSVFYNWKFIILLWISNAAISFILSTPIYYLLIDNLNHSLMSDKLALGFDYTWYIQLRALYQHSLEEIPYMMYIAVIFFVLVQTLYTGGLISIFNTPKKNHIVDFFYGGIRFWYRFIKVVLISAVLYAAALWINGLLGDLLILAFRNSENELAEFILRSLRYILLVFFIVVISLISDYTKVCLAVKDGTKTIKSISAAVLFVQKNFFRVFTVFIAIAVIFTVGAVLYNFFGSILPRTPYYFLAVSFFMQQMLIIFRLLIRMLFYSTEVTIYKDISAEIVETTAHEQN
ncbi:hypothetical protein ACFLQT_01310 [Bacteroidota bacterium]